MSFKKGFTMIALTVVAAAGVYTIATDRNTTSIQKIDRNTTMIDRNTTSQNV
ncbi:RapH phosphatase inhibitor [Bacillus altitudinis]|uniref:RapH phosphatase inhibitor n=1 Tax=Bacillus TaxID=1386 RepID=UPI00227F7D17|nr:RapH phosphatase inhibitor [Bacillus altitudinis]MCY7627713.1 RapH phosphatase inhibitor [Bacillus altitudinis]MDX2363593.1 RapH phosphatase inhibitor [Bacillus altitudinis]